MRIAAALISLVAAMSLFAQWRVSAELMVGASPISVIWRMLAYFTVLSNAALSLIMARTVVSGKIPPQTAALVTVIMCMVGLGYHTLLAGIWVPEGLAWWADQGLHTVGPVLTMLWWVAFAPKSGMAWALARRWLVWPITYCAYALVRGLATGFYPYPFVNITTLGIAKVALNITGLACLFLALAISLIGIARVIR